LQANSQLKVNCDNTCQKPDSTSCTGTAAGACLNLDLGEETCGKGECLVTVKKCLNGVPQVCIPKNPAPAETCNNGKDDDCDGIIDNPPGQTKPQCNVCGDGIIDNLEACDHSNLDPGIGCSTDCRTILCGEPNEARHSLDPSTKTCYWRRNDNENWDGAQGRCGDRRGFLVQTETQAEREYLFANLVVPGGWGSKCWIGAKRDGSTVKWADGTTASAPGFVWGDGKPQGLGDCIMTVGVENDLGYDNDMCLLATHDYICERPLRGTPR
jgi:cysteine-rich repeat protein